jgi:hypothetical protein
MMWKLLIFATAVVFAGFCLVCFSRREQRQRLNYLGQKKCVYLDEFGDGHCTMKIYKVNFYGFDEYWVVPEEDQVEIDKKDRTFVNGQVLLNRDGSMVTADTIRELGIKVEPLGVLF